MTLPRLLIAGLVLLVAAGIWWYVDNPRVPPFVPPAVTLPSPNAHAIKQRIPSFRPPTVTLPAPNAFDIYRQAEALLPRVSYGRFDKLFPILNDPRTTGDVRTKALAQLTGEELWTRYESPKTPDASRPALLRLMPELVAQRADALRLVRSGFPHDYLTPPVYSLDTKEKEDRAISRRQIDDADKSQLIGDIDLYYRQVVEQLKRPMRNRQSPSVPPTLGRLVPRPDKAVILTDHRDAWARLLVVKVALQALRQARGHPPETLDDLVPDFLTRLPCDPYDGNPLRYRRQGEGSLLYSVGQDGVDDGGQACPGHAKSRKTTCRDPDCRGDLLAEAWEGL